VSARLIEGDCVAAMRVMAEKGETVHAVVTDPPYHLTSIVKRFGAPGAAPAAHGTDGLYARASAGFMGKEWDGGDIAFRVETWRAVWDVLPPGGHVVAFGGTRTFHRMAVAIEDAGFEIRDTLMWLYGTGFPKSHDAARAVEAHLRTGGSRFSARDPALRSEAGVSAAPGAQWQESSRRTMADKADSGWSGGKVVVTLPEAAAWTGWGTALKPAWEPIILARKPLAGTVAANVLAHGTGALNIDGCRAGDEVRVAAYTSLAPCHGNALGAAGTAEARRGTQGEPKTYTGRWPANVVHDGSGEVEAAFPRAPGQQGKASSNPDSARTRKVYGAMERAEEPMEPRGDSGSASRFFYSAKASAADRAGSKHPTVKPIALMRWLVRMVCPPGGTVLDPFAGSGTTGAAALAEGMSAVLIEREAEYQADIRRRLGLQTPDPRALAASLL
jgi:DNA modification methylase